MVDILHNFSHLGRKINLNELVLSDSKVVRIVQLRLLNSWQRNENVIKKNELLIRKHVFLPYVLEHIFQKLFRKLYFLFLKL